MSILTGVLLANVFPEVADGRQHAELHDSKRFQPAPVYHALLQQDGVHLPEAPFGTAAVRTAGSIRHTAPPFFDPQMPVSAARLTLLADESPAALVGTGTACWGS